MPNCARCGEEIPARAKFCPNCGEPLAEPVQQPSRQRPAVPFVLATVAAVCLIAVAYFMSDLAAVPGTIDSPLARLFREVGFFQVILGLLALYSAFSLYVNASKTRAWGWLIVGIGVASIISLLLIAAQGTAGVLVLAVPGLLALIAGRRSASWKKGH